MTKQLLTVLALWALFGAFVCQSDIPERFTAPGTAPAADGTVGRRELAWSMREQKALNVLYSAEAGATTPAFAPLAEELIKSLPNDWSLHKIAETSLTASQLQGTPLVILGRNFHQPDLTAMLGQLPFQLSDSSFVFHGQVYDRPELSFRLFFYPNPNSATPLFLISGNSQEAIRQQMASSSGEGLGNLFWRSWGYEIYEGERVIVRGNLDDRTWAFNPDNHFDFSGQAQQEFKSTHFRLHDLAGLGRPFLEQLATELEVQLQKVYSFSGKRTAIPVIDYYLYPSIEDKGLRLMDSRVGQVIPEKREVHVVINETFQGQYTHQELYLVLTDLLGNAAKPVMAEGLAAHFNTHWQKDGPTYWAARLYRSNNLPPLRELLDDESFGRESPLVSTAAAGAFTSFLIQQWGRERVLTAYHQWPELDAATINELESGWHQYLSSLLPAETETASAITLPYFRGFNFAHEGYQIYNGYGSKLARRSLEKLEGLGTNAIAIVPYGFQRNAKQASFLSMQHGAGSENDESVIFAHAQAQQLGMYTLLKPQLWISGAWPGEVEMPNDAEWQMFFDHYYRWIRHYALMAEMYHFDALCLGVEFSKATLQQPEHWRSIIRRIRGLYSGPITYAANWGEEFEQLSFWEELDFIGLNCYYPLSSEEKPSKNKLKNAFAEVLQKAEKVSRKYHKPLVFTEVGFRSVQHSWKNPHAEAEGRPYDPECQRICYEVLFEGIEGKDWIDGLFLWKWPSYLGHEDGNPIGFTPSGKPAELVVQNWFSSKLGD